MKHTIKVRIQDIIIGSKLATHMKEVVTFSHFNHDKKMKPIIALNAKGIEKYYHYDQIHEIIK